MSTVTCWGCACLHTIVGEGRAVKKFLTWSGSAVCGYCGVLGLLLCLYIHYVQCPVALLLFNL